VHFSLRGFLLSLALVLSGALSANIFAQDTPPAAPVPTPQATPKVKAAKPDKNAPAAPVTADQVAESVLIIYGGRGGWGQMGRTTLEHGKIAITNGDGTVDNATYEKRIIRGADVEKDKWRIDQKFPSVEFALVYNAKIFGLLNDSVFTPRQDAILGFESQMYHGLDTLLRY
jgi:hypothetical protein